jgi:hypothetical protein
MKLKLTGFGAIEAKENNSAIVLCKYSDPIEGARENLTAEEAHQIAKEDPSLIYAMVEDNEIWDRQIEKDSITGALDFLRAQ